MSKKFLVLAVIFGLSMTGLYGFWGSSKIEAKFASEEIEGDFMTVWAKNFAKSMKKQTDGDIEIVVYPYGTIGDNRDINELCQMGVAKFVFSDYAWISAFVPQAQVLCLNYIWPKEKTVEVIDWVTRNGKFFPMLEEKFKEKGLFPFALMFEGWQWVTSKKPANTVSKIQGMKTRVMGSKLLVENLLAYGMTSTPMPYGEIYSGLQTGLLDAQINPMFADYSMKFYEVTDYFTQFWAEVFVSIPTVNLDFYNSLSDEQQKMMKDFWVDAIIPAGKWITKRNADDKAKIAKERPKIKFYEYNNKQIKKMKSKARNVFKEFGKVGGKDADIMLKALLKDIEDAKKALGVK